jgi:hypothetical protein
MAESRDLAPAELDRLEDALEQLEVFGVPDELRGRAEDRELVERLEAYRAVLDRSRAAMPMLDVPPGLLDAVIAEAHRGAAPATEPRASVWKRLRLTIVMPALAFAGAAALLVAIVGRDDLAGAPAADRVAQANEASKADAKSAAAPGLIADASTPKQEAQGELAPGDGERGASAVLPAAEQSAREITTETRADAEEKTDEIGQLGRAKGTAAPSGPPAPKSEKKPSSAKNGGDDPFDFDQKKKDKGNTAPSEEPPAPTKPKSEPKPSEPAPNEPQTPAPGAGSGSSGGIDVGWSTIEQADSQRRAGKCGLARVKYEQGKKANDAKIRARALAGIGLCERAEGNAAGAEEMFRQARAQDPKVDAFIAAETKN